MAITDYAPQGKSSEADGPNEKHLERFIINVSSNSSDDNISDSGEDDGSMEEDDLAEDACCGMIYTEINVISQ